MKRITNLSLSSILTYLTFTAILIISGSCKQSADFSPSEFSDIKKAFIEPLDSNKVWCYYYWINDDISKEGVTKDLEAMKEFGIGAALVGNINPDKIDGPVPLFSQEWWDIMVHTVNEGKRLDMDIGFFNCPGWSQSGGPWVTYDKAMRHMVYSEAKIKGSVKIQLKLEKPANEFQDSYVLAFKSIEAESIKLNSSNTKIVSKPALKNAINLIDANLSSSASFEVKKNNNYSLEFQTEEYITARSIVLHPDVYELKCDCKLSAWMNGEYKVIKSFTFDRSNIDVKVGPEIYGPVAISFPVVKSNKFKLDCSNIWSRQKKAGFSEIIISESPVLEKYIEKSLGKMHPTPFPRFETYMWEAQSSIENDNLNISEVVDLSANMDENGILTWDVPAGNWTVLRMGMTPTGTKNAPASPQGEGYEVDKANAELARFHFNNYMAKIIEKIPKENRSALKYVIADSYEMGSQNWTDGFEQKFEAKFDYNPVKYLPVFSGRIVGSVEESDRFLWDLRRAVADDVAKEYVGGLRKISNENNMKLWLENYGHWGYPGEFLMYGGQSDLVSGEFWNEGTLGNIECKSASSAAHIYGKPITSGEAFTASSSAYKRHPAVLKKRGDWSYTEGINHFVLHLYIHQPDDKRIPGVNAWFSTEFNRHNTWFKQGKVWVDYLRRCQHMLQQGKYAADVVYFIGEDAPKMTGTRDPELPKGYSYDYINAEVILNRLSVKDGDFVLPDGMTYKLLVLPNIKTIRPEVLAKIEELVKDGGTVLGPKPEKSPSLQNYPECDQKVQAIASNLWPDNYSDSKLINTLEKGLLLDGTSIQEALDLINVPVDVDMQAEVPVLWTHRTMAGMEIYFLTNQSDKKVTFTPSFRVNEMMPQAWNAVSGEIRKLNEFSIEKGRTVVPVSLNAEESIFIVFTKKVNEINDPGYQENFPEAKTLMTLNNEWTVDFKNKDIGPVNAVSMENLQDWTKSNNDKIKYYSGTALYQTKFKLYEIPENSNLFINLGNVGVMASVKLNGEYLGGVWIAPFTLALKDQLKKGENSLEVEVVNTWRNQLIKDETLPKDEKYTWLEVEDVKAGEDLMTSGLIGPVTIKMISFAPNQ